ncbi:YceI family protein [Corynebacterium canis]|uniref:YceI family protein n=1 Tax=Corynebacterium canis TaxID=679663 RepID=A0A5C5URN6_9CORY|nr:YceI family protein [Corynebacterium canis]TWT29004.1 YceI family protein [Corynebacterium canis]WJY75228.1 YceI-like domain protein [Corynebacterium canis]
MRKPFLVLTVIAIVLLTLASVGPVVYKALTDPGIKTGGLNASQAVGATTELSGTWKVIPGSGANTTSVGYTFFEILPGEPRSTSGSTRDVTGSIEVVGTQLKTGAIEVDMTTLRTDVEQRDINVRRSLLHTDDYPKASFELTNPAELSNIPDNGTVGKARVIGNLQLHGASREVSGDFEVLRTAQRLVVAGTLPLNRLDFGVETPEFVAAKIDEQGELNIRLTFEKVADAK